MYKAIFILFIVLCFQFRLHADSKIDGKTVSFTEFMDEMVKSEKYTTFENVKIRYDYNVDKPGMDARFEKGGPDIIVKQRMRLLNCEFDEIYWLVMRNVTFNDYLVFFGCKPIKAIFSHCSFKKTLRIYTSELEFIDFDTCNFELGFKVERTPVKDRLKFAGCNFSFNPNIPNPTTEYDMGAILFVIANKNDALDLTLQDCAFNLPDSMKNNPDFFLNLTDSHFSNLRMFDNKFNANVDFSQSTVDNTFLTYDCEYNGKIMMDAFNINPVNTQIQWSTVSGNRLAVYDAKSKRIFHGGLIDSLHDEFLFDNLISRYASFYGAFRAQGNKISANECYVEWKNIETKYFKNRYIEKGGKNNFFSYIMNEFLRIFCDYGTNPLKAINIALYVLLAFASIYFFFPYTVKVFGRRSLFQQLKIYGYYLSSPKSLLEIESAEFAHNKDPKSYSEYISFLRVAGKAVPWYFNIFAKPLYFIERLKEKPAKLFYKIIDLFPDEWTSMSGSKKLLATIVYGFVVLFTIVWFLLIHTLDSIMLSLNVFSTLGFGQIPIKGIPRYLTIVEGFVGWFLLSIFIVSLISQVIQ